MSIVAFPTSSHFSKPRTGSDGQSESPLSLADYLQMVSLGRHAVRLVVVTAGGDGGIIDAADATVLHATLGDSAGIEAVTRMLAAEIGEIRAVKLPKGRTHPDQGMPKPIDQLLLDLAFEADSTAPREPESREEPGPRRIPQSGSMDFSTCFRQAMGAYLERDLDRAVCLFERCDAMRPGDVRVAANLLRLRRAQRGST